MSAELGETKSVIISRLNKGSIRVMASSLCDETLRVI